MTFAQFETAYRETFRLMMSYSLKEVGSSHYAEQLAALSDAHPDWAEQVENMETEPAYFPGTVGTHYAGRAL